jgi:hypothetical protein
MESSRRSDTQKGSVIYICQFHSQKHLQILLNGTKLVLFRIRRATYPPPDSAMSYPIPLLSKLPRLLLG